MSAITNRAAPPAPKSFSSAEDRWRAVLERDPAADGAFYYSVRTTGVYCRNVCPARRPLRRNVRFHNTCADAEAAGFRPCRRCRPNEATLAQRQAAAITRACRLIEQSNKSPQAAELAAAAGLSPAHFQRVFKAHTGISPARYAAACRAARVRKHLPQGDNVTEAIYAAGFESSSRFYSASTAILGMRAKAFQNGGRGESICFAVGECWLGNVLVAASAKGVCAILLGNEPEALVRELQDRFPQAELIGGDAAFEQLVARVVGFVAQPSLGLDLPLDIRGTAFQQRVWDALQKIPPGMTATYSEIAQRLGVPRSVRAVAGACAANALAVAIPCHRVVRTDGSLSGYRWGVERKRDLLAREREQNQRELPRESEPKRNPH